MITIYKCKHKIDRLEIILEYIKDVPNLEFKKVIERLFEEYLGELLNTSFEQNSTSSSHNDSHLYKCDILREILKELRQDIKYIK